MPNPSPAPERDADTLGAMTFNLRFAHHEPPHNWPDRRPLVREVVETWGPDLIGTQEGLYLQIRDLEADLPAYRWLGEGREGGSHGEYMAVFYRHDRFDPREYGHFWLSDTPDRIGSRSWGNELPRMVTWVRLLDRYADRELVFVNTHLDHRSDHSRHRSAELIAAQVNAWEFDLPMLLAGDFNSEPETSYVDRVLTGTGDFVDTWRSIAETEGMGTFHGFQGVEKAIGTKRMDRIFARGPVTSLASEIVTLSRDGRYPSDHFPVFARVRVEGGP